MASVASLKFELCFWHCTVGHKTLQWLIMKKQWERPWHQGKMLISARLTCHMYHVSHVQKIIPGLTHKGYVLQRNILWIAHQWRQSPSWVETKYRQIKHRLLIWAQMTALAQSCITCMYKWQSAGEMFDNHGVNWSWPLASRVTSKQTSCWQSPFLMMGK